MNDNTNKEAIDSHCETLAAVCAQQREYARLICMDLAFCAAILAIAYLNFTTFEANILIGGGVYLLYNAFKRFVHYRIVKLMREQLLDELVKLLAEGKRGTQ